MSLESDEEQKEEDSIISLFDSVCVSFGDNDAIALVNQDCLELVSYLEIQEASKTLAHQLCYRYRPDYVLVDCFGNAVAEAVAVLACIRLCVPFVPVSVTDLHPVPRLTNVVRSLDASEHEEQQQQHVAAICCVANDRDERLGVFYKAQVHRILFLDPKGNLQEQLPVPQIIPANYCLARKATFGTSDALYVLFTSGTSGKDPKAVIGSHRSTLRRLKWFRDSFVPSPRVARRTPLTFVDGVTELLGALLQGDNSLLVAPKIPDVIKMQGLAAFWDVPTAYRPTQMTLLPSQLEQLLLLLTPTNPRSVTLDRVLVSGEIFPVRLFQKLRDCWPGCEVLNLYGQTETSGDVMCAVLTDMKPEEAVYDGRVVAVGQPILPSIIACELDPLRKEEDDSSTIPLGEIVVHGNLSRGYLTPGREDDAGIFQNFRTGDIGFYMTREQNQKIWYVNGRVDDVVKINGIWTSPNEVESAVSNLLDQTAVATIVHGKVHVVIPPTTATVVERIDINRELMREKGIPWNLIPTRVFCNNEISFSYTGSGKVSRSALKESIASFLENEGQNRPNQKKPRSVTDLVGVTLNLQTVDPKHSFVNLGGDSASAVTLLYHLRQERMIAPGSLSAADILAANSISDIDELLKSGPRKKQKLMTTESSFHPRSMQQVTKTHDSVQFAACLDAGVAVLDACSSVIVGCQGGVIQRVCCQTGRILASRQFPGWMVEADCLLWGNDTVIVCFHKHGASEGMVASLTRDFELVHWSHNLPAGVKATPLLCENQLFVHAGQKLYTYDVSSGIESCPVIELPVPIVANPLLRGDSKIYLSANWDFARLVVVNGRSVSTPTQISSIGPIHKNGLVVLDNKYIFVADSYGAVHLICADTYEIVCSSRVASAALSSPALAAPDQFVVGSYDGTVSCVRLQQDKSCSLQPQWSVFVGATVYTKPLVLPNDVVVITTTAGDVIQLHKNDGRQLGRRRIAGEIWSDPVVLDQKHEQQGHRICFGARDSCLHLLTLTTEM